MPGGVFLGILIALLLFALVAGAIFAWKFYKKTKKNDKDQGRDREKDKKEAEGQEEREKGLYYYETNEWRKGTSGVRFARADPELDSLVYVPARKQVCWFHGRRVADVQPDGQFVLRWPNGGEMRGRIKPGDPRIELFGIAGTPEEGVIERMVLTEKQES